jgi:hypothetical protein
MAGLPHARAAAAVARQYLRIIVQLWPFGPPGRQASTPPAHASHGAPAPGPAAPASPPPSPCLPSLPLLLSRALPLQAMKQSASGLGLLLPDGASSMWGDLASALGNGTTGTDLLVLLAGKSLKDGAVSPPICRRPSSARRAYRAALHRRITPQMLPSPPCLLPEPIA